MRSRIRTIHSELGGHHRDKWDKAGVTMTLTDILLAEAEANYAVAERLIRRVSDDEVPWAPSAGKNWMTVGQLLMHCASVGCGKAGTATSL
ncbi:MAG: hypothetical protein JSW71_09360 [Gemmatimonadota bacterium]|nr:MAG: hypothetical protein JSW71_09360 [Gemmatimonadota bacterium]